MQNTYIGIKGYTIYKKEMSEEKQLWLKKELTIQPFTMGSPVQNQKTYPVFRESANKFYIPRYFGEKNFGFAKEYKLTPGESIDVPFQGSLREHQQLIVNSFFETLQKQSNVYNAYNAVNKNGVEGGEAIGGEAIGGGGLLDLPCASGKTVLGLYILSKLKKKTLILVHKEFLLNQWIERIRQFLPTARVGRIQGPIIDVENKDIVLGMIQSLSMKEYPSSLFSCFGFTIIDEVHHISSEVFSNTLFTIVTPYTLGLSATMNRKDGTSHVFKMFLGEVVYKGAREDSFPVVVRAIDYHVQDEEFNHVEHDFRGNPQYSTMIVKLCNYNRRSEFLLLVLKDMLQENPKQQVMILAHYRSLLTYLYDAILHRGFASVGYYVGGMKEAALKESETKQVIIATYSMAAEALDIKTLTTLIMATPKTDIEQSVGRILREKHSQPIVVDIIDSHDVFQRQWKKRKEFYKKQQYKIIHMDHHRFTNYETNAWETMYEPGTKTERKVCKKGDELLQGSCLISLKKKKETCDL